MTRKAPPSFANADDLAATEALPLFDGKAVKPDTPFEVGMRQSAAAAAAKWTAADVAKVDAAIRARIAEGEPFTTDDLWQRIPYVPMSKGIASRLRPFVSRGELLDTGHKRICRRGGKHDHAHSLTVWIGVER